jgi:hypothetical protein
LAHSAPWTGTHASTAPRASQYIPTIVVVQPVWLYACTYTYIRPHAMHCGRHPWWRGHLNETWSISLSIELACLPFLLHATKERNSAMPACAHAILQSTTSPSHSHRTYQPFLFCGKLGVTFGIESFGNN